jgi:N-acetylglucosaminyl-diphospho-decaprenol L-rhamnosyltransferase
MVSILIVNWNGKRFLPGCLKSIEAKITVPHEVVLVDNNSSDGSADFVASDFAWVRLVRSLDNLGFAGGTNMAARHATGKHLLLLNNDTLMETDIADAVAVLDADLRVGVVGAGMYSGEGALRLSCGHFPAPGRLWRFASMLHIPQKPWPTKGTVPVYQCDWVEGSFLLTRAEDWRRVGGMDEKNYMYGDDFDYCRSLFNLGLTVVQCPSVRYTHFGGYDHSKMGYLYAGYRKYHRKFSSRLVQLQADFVLRFGLLLRLPWYWVRAILRKDAASRSAWSQAKELNRNWASTLSHAHRYHS